MINKILLCVAVFMLVLSASVHSSMATEMLIKEQNRADVVLTTKIPTVDPNTSSYSIGSVDAIIIRRILEDAEINEHIIDYILYHRTVVRTYAT